MSKEAAINRAIAQLEHEFRYINPKRNQLTPCEYRDCEKFMEHENKLQHELDWQGSYQERQSGYEHL